MTYDDNEEFNTWFDSDLRKSGGWDESKDRPSKFVFDMDPVGYANNVKWWEERDRK